ncbi:MAG: hypothetical protein JWN36_121 [Microbacteriaceae bacterium]|nr:hypothetical protein [Microbacteriaceae bacterium]
MSTLDLKATPRVVRGVLAAWTPLAGPLYAARVARAWRWRILRLPIVLVLLVPINVLAFLRLPLLDLWVGLPLIAMTVAAGVGLYLATQRELSVVSQDIKRDLERAGTSLSSSPDLRSITSFADWCEREGVSAHVLARLGSTG